MIESEIAFFVLLLSIQKLIFMRTIIFLISFFIIVSSKLFGQDQNVEELIQEGIELHDAGEYEEAIDRYNEALEIDSTQMLAVYEISLSYLAMKDYENASLYSTQVIDSNNEQLSFGAYAVKSESLAGMDKVDDAIELLYEGLEKNGDKSILHFNLALNFFKKGDIDKTLEHIKTAIDIDRLHSGAFLLNAYALKDKGMWVQSILSFQMFLLLEPDSRRSKNAFAEMLQIMQLKDVEVPVERSFIQQQLFKNSLDNAVSQDKLPPLTIKDGLNRNFVYHAITSTKDSLKLESEEVNEFELFKTVNLEVMKVLERESLNPNEGILWTFYIPFFSRISHSDYYEAYCRYISVSYYPESFEWWGNNTEAALNFIMWFENGKTDDKS